MKARIFLNMLRHKYGDFPPWEKRLIERHPELSYALEFDQNLAR